MFNPGLTQKLSQGYVVSNKKIWVAGSLVLSALVCFVLFLDNRPASRWFVDHPLPLKETYRLFDAGIVDADGDNLLDIYTTNHHFRQALLVADEKGNYHDALSDWGLDQSREFPLAELSFIEPDVDEPGLYIYWLGTQFIIRTHNTGSNMRWQGSIKFNDPVEIINNNGFAVEKKENEQTASATRSVYETLIEFSSDTEAKLAMRPGGQGLPITINLAESSQTTHIYVGRGKISPRSTSFTLAMQDRHGMAWADYNSDGQLDIFIPRGALGGMLRAQPDYVADSIHDELLVSQENGKYEDIGFEAGIRKRDCSGRHARWIDFNQDGMLDIYVNCYDRESIEGMFPKQLYVQDNQKHFRDVAVETGIGMPGQQIGSFSWIDVDNDEDVDLVTFQDEGLFLYRNQGEGFTREIIHSRPLYGAERIGHTKGDHWNFDGKITVADYDADGDLDLFSSSKRGNALLLNQEGSFLYIDPVTAGLPEQSMTANWVDYDNDGLSDLHAIPQGIFRQTKDHSFLSTGLLTFPDEQYIAAISDWYDLDNDGRRDVFMALSENQTYKHWWDFSNRPRHSSTWQLKTYRNSGASNHWLQISLVGGDGNRQGIGSRVSVITPDGQQTQEVGSTDGAFFSQGHYRLYFGLGTHDKANIKIRWSDGLRQEISNVSGDQLLVIERDAILGR